MNVGSFYGCQKKCRLWTVAEALDEFQNEDVHADTVVVL